MVALQSFPPELLDLILQYASLNGQIVALWNTGSSHVRNRIVKSVRKVVLVDKSLFSTSRYPMMLRSLPLLRSLTIDRGNGWLLGSSKRLFDELHRLPQQMEEIDIFANDTLGCLSAFSKSKSTNNSSKSSNTSIDPTAANSTATITVGDGEMELWSLALHEHPAATATSTSTATFTAKEGDDEEEMVYSSHDWSCVFPQLKTLILSCIDRVEEIDPLTNLFLKNAWPILPKSLETLRLPRVSVINEENPLPRSLTDFELGTIVLWDTPIRQLLPHINGLSINMLIIEELMDTTNLSWIEEIPFQNLTYLKVWNRTWLTVGHVLALPRTLIEIVGEFIFLWDTFLEAEAEAEAEEGQWPQLLPIPHDIDSIWPSSLTNLETYETEIDSKYMRLLPSSLTRLQLYAQRDPNLHLSFEFGPDTHLPLLKHVHINADEVNAIELTRWPSSSPLIDTVSFSGHLEPLYEKMFVGALPPSVTELVFRNYCFIVDEDDDGDEIRYLDSRWSLPPTFPSRLTRLNIAHFEAGWFSSLPSTLSEFTCEQFEILGNPSGKPDIWPDLLSHISDSLILLKIEASFSCDPKDMLCHFSEQSFSELKNLTHLTMPRDQYVFPPSLITHLPKSMKVLEIRLQSVPDEAILTLPSSLQKLRFFTPEPLPLNFNLLARTLPTTKIIVDDFQPSEVDLLLFKQQAVWRSFPHPHTIINLTHS